MRRALAFVLLASLLAGWLARACAERRARAPATDEHPASAERATPRAELDAGTESVAGSEPRDTTLRAAVGARARQQGSLHGLVRWPDGRPAAGARIQASSVAKHDGQHAFVVATEADAATGEFVLDGATGPCCVFASLRDTSRGEGRQSTPLSSAGPRIVTDVMEACELVLVSGATLSGRVRDDTGAPITSCWLEAQPCSVGEQGERESFAFANVLRADLGDRGGDYTWSDLGRGTWLVVASSGGHARSSAALLDLRQGSSARCDFVLPRLASISGVLFDGAGAPLARARLDVEYPSDDPPPASLAQRATYTDVNGRFTLGSVTPGRARLRCESAGLVTDWIALAPAETKTGLRLVCAPR